MSTRNDLALAWRVRQARSNGFKSLVRREPAVEAPELEEPQEQHSDLSLGVDEAEQAPEAPQESRLASIVRSLRLKGLE